MTDKGPTIFSPRSAELLMLEQASRGNPYSFDIDHMSLNADAPVENHRAVGKHQLEVRDGDGGPELWCVSVRLAPFIVAGMQCDPPEWMSFSPAYDLDAKTNEVISYLNTAITNNPATWNVTQLANRTDKGAMHMALSKADMIAAFSHMAKGEMDSGSMSSFAQAMLAMIQGGAVKTAEDEPHAEPDGDEAPKADAEPDGDEAPKEDAEEPDGDEEKTATKATKELMDLAREVQTLKASMAKRDDDEKRAKLLASRSDFDPKVVSILKKAPLSQVEFAVNTFPRSTPNLAAAQHVQATRGAEQGGGSKIEKTIADSIDAKMGIRSSAPAIRTEEGGRVQVLGALHGREGQEEAKRILARKAGA